MDTSKKYIEMCKEATELRELWVPSEGDWVRQEGGQLLKKESTTYALDKLRAKAEKGWYAENAIDCREFTVWLPRQDQLQEMVKSEPYFAWNYIGMLSRWASDNVTYSCGFDSMEQLWLAFVMQETYSKIWNEERWIRKNN